MRILLDTNIVIRWIVEPKRLSKNQMRALEHSTRHCEPVGVSAITLLEIALLFTDGSLRIKAATAEDLFDELETNPVFQILPLNLDIARRVLKMGRALRDPADRVITATACVHDLRLLTSDRRIMESNLVETID